MTTTGSGRPELNRAVSGQLGARPAAAEIARDPVIREVSPAASGGVGEAGGVHAWYLGRTVRWLRIR